MQGLRVASRFEAGERAFQNGALVAGPGLGERPQVLRPEGVLMPQSAGWAREQPRGAQRPAVSSAVPGLRVHPVCGVDGRRSSVLIPPRPFLTLSLNHSHVLPHPWFN